MYTIRRVKSFEKSFRRIVGSGLTKQKKENIEFAIDTIASGKILDKKYKDHPLEGKFVGYRECHILNDLLLVYKIEKKLEVLILVDIGSHSQVFG